MNKEHKYQATTTWVGHDPKTPFTYQFYDRSHGFKVDGKPSLNLSADAGFLGDEKKLNPEDCLIAALSSCHMLSYLAFAAMRNVPVLSYVDHASGVMLQEGNGGRFTKVTLAPTVTILNESDRDMAEALHETANKNCFIASSVNFPIFHRATIRVNLNEAF